MKLGVVGRYNKALEPADIEAIKVAQIEAVKVRHWTCPALDLFTVVQPPLNDSALSITETAYESGVRHFIVHRHPNTYACGLGTLWANGRECAEHWIGSCEILREMFPEIQVGFPALRYGGDVWQIDAEDFWENCQDAVAFADFYEIECWWKNDQERRIQLWRIDSYQRFAPKKPIVITFANTNSAVPKRRKAEEYLEFYKELARREDILAGFCFCLSSEEIEHQYITWRSEGGKMTIPKIIGGR